MALLVFQLFFFSLHVYSEVFTGLVPAVVLRAESRVNILLLVALAYCKHR